MTLDIFFFVHVHLRCIANNLKKKAKCWLCAALEKFLRTPMQWTTLLGIFYKISFTPALTSCYQVRALNADAPLSAALLYYFRCNLLQEFMSLSTLTKLKVDIAEETNKSDLNERTQQRTVHATACYSVLTHKGLKLVWLEFTRPHDANFLLLFLG